MSVVSKKPPNRARSNPKSYPLGVRWALAYPPEVLRKLKEVDPAAYEWLMRFNEAELGSNPSLLYSKKKDRNRCYTQVNKMRVDAMSSAIHDIVFDSVIPSQNPEDAMIDLIDNRHILSAMDTSAYEKTARPKPARKQGRKR